MTHLAKPNVPTLQSGRNGSCDSGEEEEGIILYFAINLAAKMVTIILPAFSPKHPLVPAPKGRKLASFSDLNFPIVDASLSNHRVGSKWFALSPQCRGSWLSLIHI